MKNLRFVALFLLLVLGGCKKNPETAASEFTPPPFVSKAVYVLNEGNFGDAAGARLTLYDSQTRSVYKDVFENITNGQHLGDTGDDVIRVGNKLYILMSHSNNIVIVQLPGYQILNNVSFPTRSPHDLAVDTLHHQLIFSNLFAPVNTITVCNDSTLNVVKDITVGANPEGLAIAGGNLFVCNSGFGADSTVSVVDLAALSVDTTLVVSTQPTSAAVSSNGMVLIGCVGDTIVKGSVYVINPMNYSVERIVHLPAKLAMLSGCLAADTSGNAFVIAGREDSYYGGPIHKIILATGSVEENYLNAGVYYGLAVNPFTNELFASDVKNFAGDGTVTVVRSDGTVRETFDAQRGPSVFAFRW
jgi:hypothetical protein